MDFVAASLFEDNTTKRIEDDGQYKDQRPMTEK